MVDEQHGSREVEEWIRRHQVRAWRFIRLCGCPADIADDLVQDALMAALHKMIHLEPDARGAAWLRAALQNLWLMHRRSEGRRVNHVRAARVELALQQCASADDGEAWIAALRGCLEVLDTRARRVLELHYTGCASREAIGAEVGLRVNGVKAYLRRVRALLRDCVLRKTGRSEVE